MKLIHAQNVYSFILDEDEWYSATVQQREAWITQIMREGAEAHARYLNIMVDPDAVMSISPLVGRHQVWRHSFNTADNLMLCGQIVDLCDKYRGKLTRHQIAQVLKLVLKDYSV